MAERRGNIWVKAFLAVCVIAFLGISIAPLLGSAFQNSSTPKSPANDAAAVPEDQRQELEEQAKGFELVLQREPTNVTALESLIEIKLQLGDIAASIAPLKKLAELSPENPDYQILLAQVQQQTGDREAAAQTYRTLITNQPGNLKALQSLAALLMQENRPTAAISLLQDTLKLAPQANEAKPGSIDVASVKLMLGEVYAQQNRTDEAIALYDEVQAESAEDFRPVLAKALVLKTQGREASEYQPLFDNAVALAPARYKDQIEQLAKGSTTMPAIPQNTPPSQSPEATAEAPAASPAESR